MQSRTSDRKRLGRWPHSLDFHQHGIASVLCSRLFGTLEKPFKSVKEILVWSWKSLKLVGHWIQKVLATGKMVYRFPFAKWTRVSALSMTQAVTILNKLDTSFSKFSVLFTGWSRQPRKCKSRKSTIIKLCMGLLMEPFHAKARKELKFQTSSRNDSFLHFQHCLFCISASRTCERSQWANVLELSIDI